MAYIEQRRKREVEREREREKERELEGEEGGEKRVSNVLPGHVLAQLLLWHNCHCLSALHHESSFASFAPKTEGTSGHKARIIPSCKCSVHLMGSTVCCAYAEKEAQGKEGPPPGRGGQKAQEEQKVRCAMPLALSTAHNFVM